MAQSETSIHTKLNNGYEVCGDRVLVQPDVRSQVKDGFYIPKASLDQFPTSGRIIKVGIVGWPEKLKRFFGLSKALEVGQRVVFSRYAGIECTFDDDIIVCLPQQDILMLIDTNGGRLHA